MQGEFRKNISAQSMLSDMRKHFDKITDHRQTKGVDISIADALMSAFAMFSLKTSSLLQFDEARADAIVSHNIRSLYGVKNIPSDTRMREIVDLIDPTSIRGAFKNIFRTLERGKALEDYKFIDGHMLVAMDGTGHFSSKKVHCENCLEKKHRDGSVTYQHQSLAAVVVHPDKKQVIAMCPEAIIKQDGTQKNDCERNAAARLLKDFRREHPHLKAIFIEDGLSSNGSHIRLLKELNLKFILGAKPGDHTDLFERVDEDDLAGLVTHVESVENGVTYRFRYVNNVSLNMANPDLKINFIEFWETSSKAGDKHFSWVTDIHVGRDNVFKLMKGGRARWSIENETFNTLKNQGYNFEHNFGHGNKNLSVNFMMLMMLAFLVDQAQQLACPVFQTALVARKNKRKDLWDKMRALFWCHFLDSWQQFFEFIVQRPALRKNTS